MRETSSIPTAAEKFKAAVWAPVGAQALRPDSRVIERPGWYQVITPSSRSTSSLNEILFSEMAENDADRMIDNAIAEYRALKIPLKWCVGPWSRPTDQGERLERRGFHSWDVRGMAADAGSLKVTFPDGITAEEVGPGNLDLYLTTTFRGWNMPHEDTEETRERYSCALSFNGGRTKAFLAYCGGEPAGTAAFLLKNDSAYFIGASVLAEFRGKGVYRALLAKRLEAVLETPVRLVTTQAREATSAPILERLGFETVFRSKIYQLDAG